MSFLKVLPLALVLTYSIAYLADYGCDGCLQEKRPIECSQYRGNPISWWQCAARVQRGDALQEAQVTAG